MWAAALAIAEAVVFGDGRRARLRLRSDALLPTSALETFSQADEAATEGVGEVCL